MKIFIDESGIFCSGNDEYSFSCVGALVISSLKINKFYEDFKSISTSWIRNKGEIKGKDLNEQQISEVAKMLRKYDCLFELTAIDLNIESNAEHKTHIKKQILKIPSQWEELRRRLENLSDQLYVQFVVLMQLIPRIIEHSLPYYAQHEPSELAHFDWVIDAKDLKITSYEQLWKALVSPFLQTCSLSDPVTFCKDKKFNYRYFDKFFSTTIPEYLRLHFPISEQNDAVLDIKKIMENLTFQRSERVNH